MRELHLFAGCGGGIIGGILLGHTCVCAVEIEPYCRAILRARQIDGLIPFFPIFEDVNHIRFDTTAKILYDRRHYEIGQKKEGLPAGEKPLRFGHVDWRNCSILRKNSPGNVAVDDGSQYKDEIENQVREPKPFLEKRENGERQGAEYSRKSDSKGDCYSSALLRKLWTPWSIQGWKDGHTSAPFGLQSSIAGHVAMSDLSPQLAQTIQSERKEVIYSEPDRIAYVGNIDVVAGGFP